MQDYRYYNAGGFGNINLVIGVPLNNIKHQDGEHTFLTGRMPAYQWIQTCDLHNTREQAENALIARFYKG
jgi:hypothetical protein